MGDKVLLKHAGIQTISASSSKCIPPARALLCVLAYSGFRPSSLHMLSASSFHSNRLFAVIAKGHSNGFNNFVSPLLASYLHALAGHFGVKPWYIHTKQAMHVLTHEIRVAITSYPD